MLLSPLKSNQNEIHLSLLSFLNFLRKIPKRQGAHRKRQIAHSFTAYNSLFTFSLNMNGVENDLYAFSKTQGHFSSSICTFFYNSGLT